MSRPTHTQPWQLPDGIDELLPAAAAGVETLRRDLLDCAARWGYQLVIPPLVEFTDSLLEGVGEDLDLLTFKVPDQISGRMLGLRADITPQVARIDAHSLRDKAVNRLCYAGSTLHTRARSLTASRAPLQLGAELYGDGSLAADLEVIDLMLNMLETAGLAPDGRLTLDLGHGAVVREVLASCESSDEELGSALFSALQRKSHPDLETLLEELPPGPAALLPALMDLHGGLEVLDRAESLFAAADGDARRALEQLRELAGALQQRFPKLSLYIDLAELRGYNYHTGVVFSVYAHGVGEAVARGGRYDNVGALYGRSRPATGFATDLRVLAGLVESAPMPRGAIAAPADGDAELLAQTRQLRRQGETVIFTSQGKPDPRCDRILARADGAWQLRPLADTR